MSKPSPPGPARRQPVEAEMRELIASDGVWTAHDISLAPGVQTLGSPLPDTRLRRIVQLVSDTAGKPFDQLRILDLGCLEGQFAIEFALHGAEVVAVEGREANLRKARFAARALGAAGVEFRRADVRDLDSVDYGQFDVILCLGILYHLDSPDVMELVASLSRLCRGMLVVDSHVSLRPRMAIDWNGHRYWGDCWTEYAQGQRAAGEEQALWSSIGNDRSFLLTRRSLCNLLAHAGFTSAYECLNPYEWHSPDWPLPSPDGGIVEWPDRGTFVAIKGARARILSSALTDSAPDRDRPERPNYLRAIRPVGGIGARLASAAARLVGRAS